MLFGSTLHKRTASARRDVYTGESLSIAYDSHEGRPDSYDLISGPLGALQLAPVAANLVEVPLLEAVQRLGDRTDPRLR